MEPDGELFVHEDANRGHWYEWQGGRILQTNFSKLMYDLPEVELSPPVKIGDPIRIGPYRFRMLEFVPDTADILLMKQRGLYISPRLTASLNIGGRVRDYFGFIALRLGRKMQEWAIQ